VNPRLFKAAFLGPDKHRRLSSKLSYFLNEITPEKVEKIEKKKKRKKKKRKKGNNTSVQIWKLKMFLPIPLVLLSMHKQRTLIHITYTLAGFEPGSSVPELDLMSIVPRHQGPWYIPNTEKEMDSITVTITAHVKSLEASLILVALQGGREPTEGSDPTLHQSLRPRWDKRMCHNSCKKFF
jgi:hypothetical protein